MSDRIAMLIGTLFGRTVNAFAYATGALLAVRMFGWHP